MVCTPAVLEEVLLELELGVTVTVTGMVAVLLFVEVTLTAMKLISLAASVDSVVTMFPPCFCWPWQTALVVPVRSQLSWAAPPLYIT